jgi:hypothetical protein
LPDLIIALRRGQILDWKIFNFQISNYFCYCFYFCKSC